MTKKTQLVSSNLSNNLGAIDIATDESVLRGATMSNV